MKYYKNDTITSNPLPHVMNATHEFIIAQGWEVYEEPVVEPTPYQLAMQDWDFHAYEMRIPVPVRWFDPTNEELNPSQKRKVEQFMQWWQISEMPIHRKNGNTYGYCHEIMPQHTQFLKLIGVMVEPIPKPEDFD